MSEVMKAMFVRHGVFFFFFGLFCFNFCFVLQDFGDTIPGHGGLVDRFDCQFLMATFVYVYHSTFIRYGG